jgi:predicted phosphate transport protein (TIGR00153 family)
MMPKEDRFFALFADHAEAIASGAEVMKRMLAGEEDIASACGRITDLERRADDIAREVLLMVRRSFITPFDRSAITDLISSMDDAIDEMRKTAKAIMLYDVKAFEPQMLGISALAEQAARLVVEAIPLLRSVGRNGVQLDALTERIVALEGQADDLHEEGIRALFHANRESQSLGFVVGREIFSHLERVLDRLEDVADEIQGIVIDHA